MSSVFEYLNGNQVKNLFYLPERYFSLLRLLTPKLAYIQSVMKNNSALLHEIG
jgi:hypothetical protein